MFKSVKMDIGEFKEVADALYKSCNSEFREGICRTAIGRYYYYTFLNIRELIKSEDSLNASGLKGSYAHSNVKTYLKSFSEEIGNKKFGKVVNYMIDLHDLRKEADYELKTVPIDSLIEAKKLTENIQYELNTLKYCNNSGFKDILNYLKAQDKLNDIKLKENVRYCKKDSQKKCPCTETEVSSTWGSIDQNLKTKLIFTPITFLHVNFQYFLNQTYYLKILKTSWDSVIS